MWQKNKSGKLYKRFEFDNFNLALEFVNKVGEQTENANHHPDITFGYGYVEVYLITHSKNEITTKDKDLAKAIDQILV
jgi:4a-hydroxytetrahydrobiopterin dehydratase